MNGLRNVLDQLSKNFLKTRLKSTLPTFRGSGVGRAPATNPAQGGRVGNLVPDLKSPGPDFPARRPCSHPPHPPDWSDFPNSLESRAGAAVSSGPRPHHPPSGFRGLRGGNGPKKIFPARRQIRRKAHQPPSAPAWGATHRPWTLHRVTGVHLRTRAFPELRF